MAYVGASRPPAECIFCSALQRGDDHASLILHRGTHSFLILNAFPYASGHLMAVINRHVSSVIDATTEELAEAIGLVRLSVQALDAEYKAHGFNIGLNQGRVAGAGIEGHLHIHVVPRWQGDSNFMPVIGDVRVLPESLDVTWDRLRGRFHG